MAAEKGRTWPAPGSARIQKWVKENVGLFEEREEACGMVLFQQQKFARAFLQHESPFRGLLLYHGLGSGKSCSAIATAEALRSKTGSTYRNVFILLPASLKQNYVNEIRTCGGQLYCVQQTWSKGSEGAWVADPTGTPFVDLPKSDQQAVADQIERLIQRDFTFIHYNGLTTKSIQQYSRGGAFDDSIIIIDEVHNMVSNLSSGKLVSHLYNSIYTSQNSKVILLSGTPIVNEPAELASLVNLVHGPIRVLEFPIPLSGLTRAETDSVMGSLYVLDAWEEVRRGGVQRVLCVRPVPAGFERSAPDAHTLVRTSLEKNGGRGRGRGDRAIRDLQARLKDVKGLDGRVAPVDARYGLLPADADAFDALFVDSTGDVPILKNESGLARRCTGCISYFKGHDDSVYPRLNTPVIERLDLSPHQFSVYLTQRTQEHKLEERAKKFKRTPDAGVGASVRPASRMACTFVFPESIFRPRPEQMESAEYAAAMEAALQQLRALPEAELQGDRLATYSPKFHAIVARLKGKPKGTSIIYSQFRMMEGINILSIVLDANGFARLSMKQGTKGNGKGKPVLIVKGREVTDTEAMKYVDAPKYIVYENDPTMDALLAIFNNQTSVPIESVPWMKKTGNVRGENALALLITASGSEGIQTRNVRQVHVIEPFWHVNRIDQVIGRARRAYSHHDLPEDERTIDVFIYLASLTDRQKGAVPLSDKGVSSDEFVYGVAQRKKHVVDRVLQIMKAASVDCAVNITKQDAYECIDPDSISGAMVYAVDYNNDGADKRSNNNNLVVIQQKNGKKFVADFKNRIIYDYDRYAKDKKLIKVGTIAARKR